MEFPIIDILDHERSIQWITKYFHSKGFGCPSCGASVKQARPFRRTRRSQLIVYRCRHCGTAYNLYTGTVFQQHPLTPRQVVLLMRGFCKGEPTTVLAAELGLDYKVVLELRHAVQKNAQRAQPQTPLPDSQTETDEMFQNAGEKRRTPQKSAGSTTAPSQQAPRQRHLRQ